MGMPNIQYYMWFSQKNAIVLGVQDKDTCFLRSEASTDASNCLLFFRILLLVFFPSFLVLFKGERGKRKEKEKAWKLKEKFESSNKV